MKKIIKFFILVIILLVLITVFVFYFKNKENDADKKLQEIYDYGDNLEKMDILPNTIVATLDGEEILFHEIESTRKSIDFAIGESNKLNENYIGERNAFYSTLEKHLTTNLVKKFPEEVKGNLDIENILEKTKNEWLNGPKGYNAEDGRKKILDVLCIEENEIWLNDEEFLIYIQNLMVNMTLGMNGSRLLIDFMIERPELANDSKLEELVEEYKNIKKEQEALINEKKSAEAADLINRQMELSLQIKELYTKDLILNSDLKLVVDKNELSTKVPQIYSK